MTKVLRNIEKQNNITFNIKSYNDRYDPYLMKNMTQCVDRIIEAINSREKIVLYGYHDVDSISSISMMLLVMRYLNADVEYYIPYDNNKDRRLSSEDIMEHLNCLGTDLIICIGCGINSEEEIELCHQLGIDVIILENRSCSTECSQAIVIDPNQSGCKYPFKDLSCSGVVFKVIEALSEFYRIKYFYKYLDLSMIGTVASEVPIRGENKLIVFEGIRYYKNTNNYGIIALSKIHNIFDINQMNLTKLIDTIITTINAVSGMDNARIVLELFTTTNYFRAEQIAKYLYTEANKVLNLKYKGDL